MVDVLNPNLMAMQVESDPFTHAVESHDNDILLIVGGAIAAGLTPLAFQPVVLANDPSRIAFYDGLICIQDRAGRTIPAAHLIPLVEAMDLGRQIDSISLDLALRFLAQNPAAKLSVNVSARSLGDTIWLNTLDAALWQQTHLGNRLIFEISESSAMMLNELVIRFMKEVQPRGIGFALDGFGWGVTTFRHLRSFFFDFAKIEKGFACGIAHDPDNQVLAEALTTVVHQFDMLVVAHGIERGEDADFFPCDRGRLPARVSFRPAKNGCVLARNDICCCSITGLQAQNYYCSVRCDLLHTLPIKRSVHRFWGICTRLVIGGNQ